MSRSVADWRRLGSEGQAADRQAHGTDEGLSPIEDIEAACAYHFAEDLANPEILGSVAPEAALTALVAGYTGGG